MAEPYAMTLAQMAAQIRQLKLSPVTLLESLLKRIDSLEPSLHAWVTIDRQRLHEDALRCAKEILRGKSRGPLHGIPIGIKDIYYTAGMTTTGGSKIFADFLPAYDATAVSRLKRVGAIVLGKTATTDFAYADPAPTRNPWNLEHTPGGSSSGSAAAVATCMCPAALGTQTAGSVLRPAAYCGVVGLKPTYGRISRHGVFPLSWTLDHVGCLTRTVEDAAILLRVLAGHDPEDQSSSEKSVTDYTRSLRSPRRPPRIGLVREFYEQNSEEQVWRHTKEIVRVLKRAGARVAEVKMPGSFGAVQEAHRIIMKVEAASFHEKLFAEHRDSYRPKIRELVETGLLIPGVDYLHAQKIKSLFRREMDEVVKQFDCLLTPATSSPAPRDLSSTGNPWFQVPWSLAGLPAISIPSGLSREGLPLGIQLVGSAFAETKLFIVARWCEKVLQLSLSPEPA